MWMKYSTLSETKSSSFKKEIAKQIEQLEEKVSKMALEDFSASESDKKSMLSRPPRSVEPPKSQFSENPEVLGVRSNVKLSYSAERGRHLVAEEDILPGETLITETPYSSILLPEYYSTH